MEVIIKGAKKKIKIIELEYPIKPVGFNEEVFEIEGDIDCEEIIHEIVTRFNVVAFCR